LCSAVGAHIGSQISAETIQRVDGQNKRFAAEGGSGIAGIYTPAGGIVPGPLILRAVPSPAPAFEVVVTEVWFYETRVGVDIAETRPAALNVTVVGLSRAFYLVGKVVADYGIGDYDLRVEDTGGCVFCYGAVCDFGRAAEDAVPRIFRDNAVGDDRAAVGPRFDTVAAIFRDDAVYNIRAAGEGVNTGS